MNVKWIATLNDGRVLREHEGMFQIIPGERTPWVRLTQLLEKEQAYLDSLALEIDGYTIYLPNNKRNPAFNIRVPLFYSLQYIIEGEMGNPLRQQNFVDITAHYEGFQVHLIQSINTREGHILITDNYEPMAPARGNEEN